MTREEKNAYQRQWRKNHPDAVKRYNIKNPHRQGYNRDYYLAHREKILKQVKSNYQKKRFELSLTRHDKYAAVHGTRVYVVIAPDGSELQFKTLQQVGDYMGYTAQYIIIVIRKNKALFGYKIEKRIVV